MSEQMRGRDAEFASLRGLLDDAARGRVRVALVRGEAGIGKSLLLDEVVEAARGRGFTVFAARADELEHNRPFGPMVDAFSCKVESTDARRAEIARALRAERSPAAGAGLQFRVIDAFVDLVESIAIERAVMIVVDDLHWADPATVTTLRSLSRRSSFLPVALVTAYRPVPRHAELERLESAASREGALQIELGPLDEDEVGALVTETIGSAPRATLRTQVASAAGNPLFVKELLGALLAEGALVIDASGADVREVSLPPSLRLTILRRISFLSDQTLGVLRIAAVLGSTFSPADLAIVMRRSAVDLLDTLREAMRAGLVDGEGPDLHFRHDLIREAIYLDIAGSVRAELHRDIARALAAAGAPTLRVAEHFVLGAGPGDEEAAGWLRNAALESAASAPSAAIELLQRALVILPTQHVERLQVRLEIATLMTFSGRAPEGEALVRLALRDAGTSPLRGRIRFLLVQALLIQGRWAELIDEVEAALADDVVEQRDRSRLLAECCLARFFCGDLDRATSDGEEAVRIGTAASDDVAVSLGLTNLSGIAGGRGDLLRAVELAERGLYAAQSVEALTRDPHFPLAITLMDVDRYEDAEYRLREGQALAEETGRAWSLPTYHTVLGIRRWHQGEWDDAVAEIEAGLALGDEIGSHTVGFAAHCILALIALHRGESADAAARVEAAEAIVSRSGPQWNMWLLARALARIAEDRGAPDEALRTLATWWETFAQADAAYPQLHLAMDLARLAAQLGDRARAAQVVSAVEALAERAPVSGVKGVASYCGGLANEDIGSITASIEQFRSSGRALEPALANEAAADMLVRHDQPGEAGAFFAGALSIYDALRARNDAARIGSAMRAAGIRTGSRGARKRPKAGWESLTPTEIEVVRLATQGLTNPQIASRLFISRATVRTHLSHVFGKLGLESRVELAAEAVRRGL